MISIQEVRIKEVIFPMNKRIKLLLQAALGRQVEGKGKIQEKKQQHSALVFSLFSSRNTDERVQSFVNNWIALELGFWSAHAIGQLAILVREY